MTDLHMDGKARRAGSLHGSAELQRRKELRNGRRTFRSWPLLPVPTVPQRAGLQTGPAVDWPQGDTISGDDWQDRPDDRDLGQDFALAPEASVWQEAVERLQAGTRSRALRICVLASVALHLCCAVFLISMPAPEAVEIAGGGAVSVMLVGEQAFDSLASGKADGEEAAQPVEETKAAETAEQPLEATTTQEVVDPAAIETTTSEPLNPAAQTASVSEATPVDTTSPPEHVAQTVSETQEAAPPKTTSSAETLSIDPNSVSETGELPKVHPAEPLPQKQIEAAEAPPVEPVKTAEPTKPLEKAEKKPVEKKAPTPKKVEKTKAEENKVAARKQAETEQEAKSTPAKSRKGESGEANTNAQRGASAASNNQASSDPGNAAASNYPGKVAAKLRRALKYPKSAVSSSRGETQVAFTVLANGSATGVRVVSSSGSPVLDQAAMEAVRRASPFPPIPAEAGRGQWAFTVPVLFKR